MADELNLQAEHEAFEAACPGLNPLQWEDGRYRSEVVEYHWQGWLAARRAPSTSTAPTDEQAAQRAYIAASKMGNVIFNLLQRDLLPEEWRESSRATLKEWDDSRAALSSDAAASQACAKSAPSMRPATTATTYPTSRRPHTCSQCGRTIYSGERYVRAQRPDTELATKAAFHTSCYSALKAVSK